MLCYAMQVLQLLAQTYADGGVALLAEEGAAAGPGGEGRGGEAEWCAALRSTLAEVRVPAAPPSWAWRPREHHPSTPHTHGRRASLAAT